MLEAPLSKGTTTKGPSALMRVQDGTRVTAQVEATTWPLDTRKTLALGLERSVDGGQTWRHLCSITTHCGKRDSEAALPWVMTTVEADMLIRPFLTATGQPLTVGCAVTGG